MSRSRRISASRLKQFVLFLAVSLTALAHPLMARTVGLDVWHVRQAEQELQDAKQREARLNDDCTYAQEQEQLSRAMVDDLIAGRSELPTVAREQWELNQSRTGIREYLEENRAGPNFEAKMAHNLVERTSEVCPAETRSAVRERLSHQYETAYGQPLPTE